MSFRIALGNALDRAGLVSMSPAADDDYPVSYLHDGPGWIGGRFGSVGANPYVEVDLNRVAYGDGGGGLADGAVISASDSTPLDVETDWSSATTLAGQNGTLAISSDTDHGVNGFSLKSVSVYVDGVTHTLDIEADAGEVCRFTAAVKNNFATAARVRLYDTRARCYLSPGGEWVAAATDFVSDTGGVAWSYLSKEFAVLSAEVLGAETTTLRLTLLQEESGGAYFDDLTLVTRTDVLGVFNGHNVPGNMVATWETGDVEDYSDIATKATLTIRRHQFWAMVDPFIARFHRLLLTGTPPEEPYLSDLVLSLTTTLPRGPSSPFNLSPPWRQTKNETAGGTRHISNRGPYPPRSLSFDFKMEDDDQFAEIMDALVTRAKGGAVPALLFPETDVESLLVIYGDLTASITFARPENNIEYRECSISIDEGAGFSIG